MKRMSLLASALLVLGLVPAAGAQNYPTNGSIGVYADQAGTICCITAPRFEETYTYVIAKLSGATANGITGAEFRLEFSPSAAGMFTPVWEVVPAAAGTSIGNPLDFTPGEANPNDPADDRRGNVAFPLCQPCNQPQCPPGGPTSVLLGTLLLVPSANPPPQITIRTKRGEPPSGGDALACPLLVLCNAPNYTAVCTTVIQRNNVDGLEPIGFVTRVNVPGCTECGPVAVEQHTWSGVKSLFQ